MTIPELSEQKKKEQIENIKAALLDVADFIEGLATEQKAKAPYKQVKKEGFTFTSFAKQGKGVLANALQQDLQQLLEIAEEDPTVSAEEIASLFEKTLEKAELVNKAQSFSFSQDTYQKLLTRLKEQSPQQPEKIATDFPAKK